MTLPSQCTYQRSARGHGFKVQGNKVARVTGAPGGRSSPLTRAEVRAHDHGLVPCEPLRECRAFLPRGRGRVVEPRMRIVSHERRARRVCAA